MTFLEQLEREREEGRKEGREEERVNTERERVRADEARNASRCATRAFLIFHAIIKR